MSRAMPRSWMALMLACLLPACGDSLPPPGVVAPDAPVQSPLPEPKTERLGDYQFEALASFSLAARVLAKERYWFGRESDLAPYDLALGWGPMSDSAVYGKLDIEQYGRWYHYSWGAGGPPIAVGEIIRHSANMHIIPASSKVKSALGGVDRHDSLYLEGYLVEIRGSDGWRWRSSLTREDSGGGSCEVFVVTRLERPGS